MNLVPEDDLPGGLANFQVVPADDLPGAPAPAAKKAPESRNLAAVLNDTVISIANAAAGGVSAAADFVAPGNRVSQFIDEELVVEHYDYFAGIYQYSVSVYERFGR